MSWAPWRRASAPTSWFWTGTRSTSRSCRSGFGSCTGTGSGSWVERSRLLGVEGGQAARFVLEFAPRSARERFEELEPDPPALVAPRARHRPVHDERGHRLRRPRAEDEASIPFGQDL